MTIRTTLAALLLAATGISPAIAASVTPVATGDAPVSAAIAGRSNHALASGGGVAFSSTDLTPAYAAPRVNDGVIDHSGNSWIPTTTASTDFVAVKFGAAQTVGAIVFHGQTGYNGRSAGTWSLQYTTDAAPAAGSAWTEIGTYTYAEPSCAQPMPRSLFSFTPVAGVTAVRLVLQNSACGNQLAVQELEAYGPLVSPPTIDAQPSGGSVVAGSDFTFTVSAAGASTYQWRKDGNAIAGATSANLFLSDVKASDAGTYSVVVANSAGSVTSDNAVLAVTPAPTFATYAEAVLNDNPIHYYPLDDTSGTTAADLGSLATAGGTYTGGFTLGQASASARLGNCVQFDGAEGTFIDLGLFHPGNSVTLEAWVNADPSAPSTYKAIIARWDGSYEMDWNPSDVGNLVIRNDANAFGIAATASPISRGQWHHMVSVFDAGTLTIYVDGVQGSSQTIGGVLRDAGPTRDRVLVGATRTGNFNWKGLIDEVAIYDTALTPAQIRSHFRASQPGPPSLTIQNAVIVSWPSFPPGYVLQCAGAVGGPYTNYTGSIFTEGSNLIAPVPIGPAQKFFQLVKP